jgi:accessory gene regulator protein AgrB
MTFLSLLKKYKNIMKMAILLIVKGLIIEEITQFVLVVVTWQRIGLQGFRVPDAEKYAYIAVSA